ncbi:unnamed protein product [Fraxinus pennsylvanica]|uniref:Uncharacterized protein n=1 Tax=Fraxinus pennsylvanica TaxID=56036 RepID=A0AAD2AAI0_9LAMI|nr:unnamed protein product [Fraxinus pennsylvanica]
MPRTGKIIPALDIIEGLDPQCRNEDERLILGRARAKRGTSLVEDATSTTCEDYLSSGITLKDMLIELSLPCTTPLHDVACEGPTILSLEILRLKPSLGKKLNLDGLSPLDLVLHNGHDSTAKQLVNHDPNLIRVPGKGGITHLHYVVETEKIDHLIKFLLECPSSIKDLTIRMRLFCILLSKMESLELSRLCLVGL